MSVDPASKTPFPDRPSAEHPSARDSRTIGVERFCELLLAHRRIERVYFGIPEGFQGLRDPRTGETWLIPERSLLRVS